MPELNLNGTWTLQFGPQEACAPRTPEALKTSRWPSIPATVPGNVELDLMAAGLLPKDLERGNHIYQTRNYEGHRWWFVRSFVSPQLPPGHVAELVFEGLDCLGEVFVNGQSVGTADNMLVAHRFDVTRVLKPAGESNELAVRIDSAVLAGRQRPAEPLDFAGAVNWEHLAIRKAPHMYGWDILPRLVSAGLWRPVTLQILPPTRWRNVYFATVTVSGDGQSAECMVDWDWVTDQINVDGWKVRITLGHGDRTAYTGEHPCLGTRGRLRTTLRNPVLWWPRGSGEAALHDLRVELIDPQGAIQDTYRCQVGIRSIELRRTDTTDPAGKGEFVFVVNGRKVFCRGTNHVPLDALHGRDPQHLKAVTEMFADLNCNMIRCWGGNVYEDHAFFEACDTLGIMVWQDFALACASYPQDEAFAAVIRREAEAVVRTLRNHASLALWAGNNEIDELLHSGWSGLPVDPNVGDRLSREVLPAVVRRLDPYRTYLPSSPYRSPGVMQGGQKPEDHLWGPRDDYKGHYYTASSAHFVSEIGYHGCPDRASLEQMTDAKHLWPWQDNDQWFTHAVRSHPADPACNGRIRLMADQTAILFGTVPGELDDFILASQASQAEAMKYFLERWRMGKWRRTGMLWWNLRDGWPVISDAVVDYYGRKKLAYPYLWRAQRDVIACVEEPHGFSHALVVVNDLPAAISGNLKVQDVETGAMLFDGPVSCAADGTARVGALGQVQKPAMWSISIAWKAATGAQGQSQGHYLAGPRPVALRDYARWLSKLGLPKDCAAVAHAAHL